MARKTAEQSAQENEAFWREVEIESQKNPGDLHGMLPFDVVMSRRYIAENIPYIAHSEGRVINVATRQEVMREAGPKPFIR